jgi:hypothetical protein
MIFIGALFLFSTCDKADQLESHVDIADFLLRCLEKERQQVEAELSRRYPGKRINSVPSATMTQYNAPGGNHTPLDRLIVDCTQEHTKVMTILGKIEGILGHPVSTFPFTIPCYLMYFFIL